MCTPLLPCQHCGLAHLLTNHELLELKGPHCLSAPLQHLISKQPQRPEPPAQVGHFIALPSVTLCRLLATAPPHLLLGNLEPTWCPPRLSSPEKSSPVLPSPHCGPLFCAPPSPEQGLPPCPHITEELSICPSVRAGLWSASDLSPGSSNSS